MTPLDMATFAAVALPCGLAVVACVGWWRASTARDEARGETGRMFKHAQSIATQWREDVARIAAERDSFRRSSEYLYGRLVETESQRDAANKRWSRAMHLLRTAEKQNRALVDAQLAGELERLVA